AGTDVLSRTPLIDFAFAGVLACFLLADLLIFHRLDGKKLRGAEVGRETRRALAESARACLGGFAPSASFGEFERQIWRRAGAGSDWCFVWNAGGEQRLIFGEVAAKTAQG